MLERTTINRIGRTLELFFIDGKPDGMRTAEVFNWTGHILLTPRTRLGDALDRKEAAHTGVYLLIGGNDGDDQVYVGEGQDIGRRIRNHDSNKDWWETAVLITTTADGLNKAHIQYLEARLIQEATNAGRAKIENSTKPALPSLSEAAETNMEGFLEHALMVLPALGIHCLVRNIRTRTSTPEHVITSSVEAQFELYNRKQNLRATARMENGEFIVEAGSQARPSWSYRPAGNYERLYSTLVKNGILAEENSPDGIADGSRVRVFREDYAFRSPSAAAAVVNGRPSNGRLDWKMRGQEKTYADWESEQLKRP